MQVPADMHQKLGAVRTQPNTRINRKRRIVEMEGKSRNDRKETVNNMNEL